MLSSSESNEETLNSTAHVLHVKPANSRIDLEDQELPTEIGACQNWIISPSFRLPDEVLFCIFELCADDMGSFSIVDSSLWNISKTCRRWRTIALSCSSLWREITIDGVGGSYPKDPVSLLRTWIERSSSSSIPLDCWVHFGYDMENVAEQQMIQLLANESHRWHRVGLDLGSRIDIYYWLAGRGSSFPILEDLSIIIYPDTSQLDDDEWPPLNGSGFADAPRLSKAELSICIFEPIFPTRPIPTVAFPWHQLTQLQCYYFVDPGFFDFASQLSSLESLKLSESDSTHPPIAFTIHHLTFPVLRRFKLGLQRFDDVISLLDNITVPALEDLDIGLPDRFEPTDQQSEMILRLIASLQTRSLCPLTHLGLSIQAFYSSRPSQIAHPLLNVRVLRLEICFNNKSDYRFPRQAFEDLRNGFLFPRLSSLNAVFYGFSTGGEDSNNCSSIEFITAIADIASARRVEDHPRVERLKNLYLSLDNYIAEATLDGLQLERFLELERGGLVLLGSAFPDEVWSLQE